MLGIDEVTIQMLATVVFWFETRRPLGCLTECPFRQESHLDA